MTKKFGVYQRFAAAGLMAGVAMGLAPAALGEDSLPIDGYQATGESENCVSINQIKRTRVLDGSNILFKMRGGKVYLNTLPRECASLDFYEAFSYKVYGSKLCSMDTISVLTGGAVPGPTCGLGDFDELEKVESE